MGIGSKLQHAWNAFTSNDEDFEAPDFGVSYGTSRPDRSRLSIANERSIISSVYNRLSIDFAGVPIKHIRTDEKGRYSGEVTSGLNNCLNVEASIDQGARAFRQDVAHTLFEKGVIAIVPVDTTISPDITQGYDILTLRVGHITKWYPEHVRVSVWNHQKGRRQEVKISKKNVAIVENPFYSVMNEPSSTLQRLIRKLNLLDAVDEQSSSGKLDLIVQLPYAIKSETRKVQAENRRKDLEFQLKGSKYGVAYTDASEKITQLNRPVENNLLKQIEYLVGLLYSQLGLTPEVMNGTASEEVMTNYMSRTIEPLLDAVTEAMTRTFLTKTARTQGQALRYYRDPFKLVSISKIAEIADKFTRNEIMASNEIRSAIAMHPSDDPKADQLINSNMPAAATQPPPVDSEGDYQNGTGF